MSKTVNLPLSAMVEDVDRVFRRAYERGCKGTTVFRDTCRGDDDQVITSPHETLGSETGKVSPRGRPHMTKGQTIKYRTGCGTLFITVNKDRHGPCEVFANLGKAGGCPAQSEATCRSISVGIRCGVDPKVYVEQLKGIRCSATVARRQTDKDIQVLSCPDAIARAIEEALGEECGLVVMPSSYECPDCSYPLRREAGCNVCDNCGYSKCG